MTETTNTATPQVNQMSMLCDRRLSGSHNTSKVYALDEKLLSPRHPDVLPLHPAAPRETAARDPPGREPGEQDPVPTRPRLPDLFYHLGRPRSTSKFLLRLLPRVEHRPRRRVARRRRRLVVREVVRPEFGGYRVAILRVADRLNVVSGRREPVPGPVDERESGGRARLGEVGVAVDRRRAEKGGGVGRVAVGTVRVEVRNQAPLALLALGGIGRAEEVLKLAER